MPGFSYFGGIALVIASTIILVGEFRQAQVDRIFLASSVVTLVVGVNISIKNLVDRGVMTASPKPGSFSIGLVLLEAPLLIVCLGMGIGYVVPDPWAFPLLIASLVTPFAAWAVVLLRKGALQ